MSGCVSGVQQMESVTITTIAGSGSGSGSEEKASVDGNGTAASFSGLQDMRYSESTNMLLIVEEALAVRAKLCLCRRYVSIHSIHQISTSHITRPFDTAPQSPLRLSLAVKPLVSRMEWESRRNSNR